MNSNKSNLCAILRPSVPAKMMVDIASRVLPKMSCVHSEYQRQQVLIYILPINNWLANSWLNALYISNQMRSENTEEKPQHTLSFLSLK